MVLKLGKFAEQASTPSSLHVGDQSVAVLDKNYLHAFAHDGKHLFTIGRYGSSAGDFNQPSDVFIHGGLYYVADKGNNRLQVFAADGKFLEEIKSRQGGEKLFVEVGPIVVDSQQNIYVADGGTLGIIHVISKDRKQVATIGAQEAPINKVTRFYGLDIDRQDRLYALASTAFNEYSIRLYKDHKPHGVFGAEGDNGTLVYFEQATSISVASGAKNSVYVNDSALTAEFSLRFPRIPGRGFRLAGLGQ